MALGVSIRLASVTEIETLQTMALADPDKGITSVLWGSGADDFLGENVFLIGFGEDTAGFCTYRSASDEIFPLVVFSPYRRQGIGREAMRLLISLLQCEGVNELMIDIVEGAELFWESVFLNYPVRHYGDRKYYITIAGNQ